MKAILALSIACCITGCTTLPSATDSNGELNELLKRVKNILPDGWKVEVWPTEVGRAYRDPDTPVLVVYRKEKPMGYFSGANMVLSVTEPAGEPQEVVFRFLSMPYMTTEEYIRISKRNEAKRQRRLEFEKQLKGIRWGHMGPRPFPPRAYDPKTEEERDLVRSYAFLWQTTEPTLLPDYWFRKLSFDSYLMPDYTYKDPKVQEEIDRVRSVVVALFKTYGEP